MLAELEALEAAARAVAALDAAAMSGTESVEFTARLAAVTGVLDGKRISGLSAVKASGVWGMDGSRSMKAWLVRTQRCSEARAGSELKLADRLATVLPLTAQALVDGEVSLEHALVISRGACGTDRSVAALADPEIGETFLLAQSGLCADEYKKLVAEWSIRVDPDAADAKNRDDRALHVLQLHDTLDGGDLRAFMSPVGSATLRAALDAFMGRPQVGDPRTPGQRRHDALVALAQRVLDGGTVGRRASVRPQLVVTVPFETLTAPAGTVGMAPATSELRQAASPDGVRPPGLRCRGHPDRVRPSRRSPRPRSQPTGVLWLLATRVGRPRRGLSKTRLQRAPGSLRRPSHHLLEARR